MATPQTLVRISSALLALSTASPLDLQRSESSRVAGCLDLEALCRWRWSCSCHATYTSPFAVSSCCELWQKKKKMDLHRKKFQFPKRRVKRLSSESLSFHFAAAAALAVSLRTKSYWFHLPLPSCSCVFLSARENSDAIKRAAGFDSRIYCCGFKSDNFLAATKSTLLFLFLTVFNYFILIFLSKLLLNDIIISFHLHHSLRNNCPAVALLGGIFILNVVGAQTNPVISSNTGTPISVECTVPLLACFSCLCFLKLLFTRSFKS